MEISDQQPKWIAKESKKTVELLFNRIHITDSNPDYSWTNVIHFETPEKTKKVFKQINDSVNKILKESNEE